MVEIAPSPERSFAEKREVGGTTMKNLTRNICMVSVGPGNVGGMRLIH